MRLSVIHNPEEQVEELVRLTYLSEEEVNDKPLLDSPFLKR